MPSTTLQIKPLLKLMRPHQWCKNGLLFLPLVFAHRLRELDLLILTLGATVCFSLMASAVYVLNDFLDVESDRLHPDKKYRPLAAGTIPLSWAPPLCAVLATLSLITASLLFPLGFSGLLLSYIFANIFYSKRLKKIPVVDVVFLTLMFILRIYAGGIAGAISVSYWLLGFCSLFFLSIAFAKRVQELKITGATEGTSHMQIRGYRFKDLNRISRMGLASGLLSVVVLSLYVTVGDSNVTYSSPKFLWMLSPLILLWMGRFWKITLKGNMSHDPVLFALKDPLSYIILLSMMLSIQLAYTV